MKKCHLICNAHLDPVWLWEIEEGIAETLSTFRVAADFCEEYDGFIFNHNEALLYEWIEEHDPILFERIQQLVKQGKWHIMGGWYLQPDCNMPSGESFVRQILAGKYYFIDKFGVEPTTSINFDSFGHTRGLVEILKKSNFDSYIFCRPEHDMLELPSDNFKWVGYQGSEITCHRAFNSYESHRGDADSKIKNYISTNNDENIGIVLWGIGNHGGGPSKIDYEKISTLSLQSDIEIIHSSPEAYFEDTKNNILPKYEGLLNPRYIGCYTSQIRIKQLHRKLENEIYLTEKMLVHGALTGYFDYPKEKMDRAIKDLLLLEFHDILPGTSTPEVEEYAIALAGHGLEEARRLKTKAFFALCRGLLKAEDGIIPIIAYNPHPYEIDGIFECEYQLPDQNKNKNMFYNPVVYRNGEKIPCQVEWEQSNFNVDWRKKSVFKATLKPSQINRFDVKMEIIKKKPKVRLVEKEGYFTFKTKQIKVLINSKTGTMDQYRVNGVDYLKENSFLPIVIVDDENSWAHKEKSFKNIKGQFALMEKQEGSQFAGIRGEYIESVRVIEDGKVRTVIEAIMKYNTSYLIQRYYLPKKGTEVKVTTRVFWDEKMTLLKLAIPTTIENGKYIGQTSYGVENLLTNRDEMVSHKWNMAHNLQKAVSIINTGTYGSDFKDGEMRITLLRSPGYSAGKSDFSVRRKYIMPQDRFSRFIDQGEREYVFYLNASDYTSRRTLIDRESLINNEEPFVISFFPTETGEKSQCFATLSDDAIQITTLKKQEKGDDYIIRLFNPLDKNVKTTLELQTVGIVSNLEFEQYEVKSLLLNVKDKTLKNVDLMER